MIIQGIRSSVMSNVISAMQARRFIRKGYEAFLALILDSKRGQVDVEKIPIVREFPDVFPEELPGIPIEREVDLSIEIVLGTAPMSRAPYRMAPTELKELKVQLQELLDCTTQCFALKCTYFICEKRKMALYECASIIDR